MSRFKFLSVVALLVGMAGLVACDKSASTSGLSTSSSAASASVAPMAEAPPGLPLDVVIDPDKLPWHGVEEALATKEIVKANYKAELDRIENDVRTEFEAEKAEKAQKLAH